MQLSLIKTWKKIQEDQDWGIVAMVLDRLFLYMFGASALFGSYMILSNSPEEDPEHTEPIDIIHSKIAAEDRMSSTLLDWNCLFLINFSLLMQKWTCILLKYLVHCIPETNSEFLSYTFLPRNLLFIYKIFWKRCKMTLFW